MNWINLRTELLRSPSFANAKSGAIEAWLRVLAYCCEQENGGCIIDGASWNDRAWMMTCGVTKAEVENAHPLLHDDGVAVFVDGYPEEKEAEVRAKRKAGKRGGKRSAALRAESNASPEVPSTASGSPSSCASTEVEGKENSNGNGKESKPRGVTEGKGSDRIPTTEQSKRIAAMFHRRLTTAWSEDEVAAYRKIGTIEPDDLSALESYYKTERAKGDDGRQRRDLKTFLNNYAGEIDKARAANFTPPEPKREQYTLAKAYGADLPPERFR